MKRSKRESRKFKGYKKFAESFGLESDSEGNYDIDEGVISNLIPDKERKIKEAKKNWIKLRNFFFVLKMR
jgi:hypothetical protein